MTQVLNEIIPVVPHPNSAKVLPDRDLHRRKAVMRGGIPL